MSSETERQKRRSRRYRNQVQRYGWTKNKGGFMRDRTKYTRKGRSPSP